MRGTFAVEAELMLEAPLSSRSPRTTSRYMVERAPRSVFGSKS